MDFEWLTNQTITAFGDLNGADYFMFLRGFAEANKTSR